MHVVGVDPSLTGCAVCQLTQGSIEYPRVATFTSSPAPTLTTRFLRYESLMNHIEGFGLGGAEVIAIEGYSFASKGGMAFDRIEFGALLRHRLLGSCSRVYEVVPTTLKLFTAGHGHADKTAMALAAYKRWGVELKDDNQTDAFALAKIAACIAGFDQPQNDAQRRAIDSVLNGKPKKAKKAS